MVISELISKDLSDIYPNPILLFNIGENDPLVTSPIILLLLSLIILWDLAMFLPCISKPINFFDNSLDLILFNVLFTI